MQADVVLIQSPAIDFSLFLGLSHKVLGFSPAESADASRRNLSDTERFLSCLASLRKPTASLPKQLLAHVSFSAMIVANDADMSDILEIANMPFVTADTLARGVKLAVVTGKLSEWRNAVVNGSAADVEPTVRLMFNKLFALFSQQGLAALWSECNAKPAQVGFYLEDKR